MERESGEGEGEERRKRGVGVGWEGKGRGVANGGRAVKIAMEWRRDLRPG